MTSSLFVRGLLAVALLIGFYALALGIAAALLWVPAAEVLYADRIHPKLALLCVFGAGMIVWSILPRIDRFQAPGPVLTRDAHPELFRHLESVAEQTGQAMPSEVFLVRDLNAWVTERGGLLGFGSRRIMGLGLPLLQLLTVSELRAVLAHEFGHFHGGDTKLGPWIYKTRAAIGRTVENLAATQLDVMMLLQLPFQAYGNLFLRITHAISRAQEYAADGLAARTQGSGALATGLQKIHGAAMAYDPYFGSEVLPALQAGYHPPIANGFARFLETPQIREAVDRARDHALANEETEVWDTHPALKDRLAAIDGIDSGAPDLGEPAISLLGDVLAAERALLTEILVDSSLAARLEPIAWEQVGTAVFVPVWREQAREHADQLSGLTPATVPFDEQAVVALARNALPEAADAPPDQLDGYGRGLLSAALATALVQRGWAVDAEPGAPVILRSGDHAIEPFNVLRRLRSGELEPAVWQGQLAAAGIAELDLGAIQAQA